MTACYTACLEIDFNKHHLYPKGSVVSLLRKDSYNNLIHRYEGGKIQTVRAMELHPKDWSIIYYIITFEKGSEMVKITPKVFKQLNFSKQIEQQVEQALKSYKSWRKSHRKYSLDVIAETSGWYYAQPKFKQCSLEDIEDHSSPLQGRTLILESVAEKMRRRAN